MKTFILLRSQCSEWVPSLAQIRCEDLFRAGDPGWNACFTASILRDAALLVPEIGECAAAIVHEDAALIDADMGIGSCYERLGTEPGAQVQNTRDKRMALIIRAKLAALLGRIARTEASTPRGEAIKARHAGRDG